MKSRLQDCEDDGETKAASKILEIMIHMEALNVIVVVSRWYGGIHLGPDRFRSVRVAGEFVQNIHILDISIIWLGKFWPNMATTREMQNNELFFTLLVPGHNDESLDALNDAILL